MNKHSKYLRQMAWHQTVESHQRSLDAADAFDALLAACESACEESDIDSCVYCTLRAAIQLAEGDKE